MKEASWSDAEADSLRSVVQLVRERWWLVVASVVVCMLIALGFSLSRPDAFTAESSVLFGQSKLADTAFGIQRNPVQPERFAATQVLVATSPEVAQRARDRLRTSESSDALLNRLTVEASENADVLSFSAQADDAKGAANLANAFASSYVAFSRDTEVLQLDAAARSLRPQIDAAPPDSPERRELQSRIANLTQLKATADGGARVIGSADPPQQRSAPTPRRDTLLGAILGLVLGLTAAFLIDRFDRRGKSVDDFERLFGVRALASIPQRAFDPRNEEEKAKGFESYRVLRSSLGFVELTRDLRVLMVTSAMPDEGKSSVAMNLARAIALSGQRVVLVECDLRKPSLSRLLEIPEPGGGLTTALLGRRPATELLSSVPGLPLISVLTSGPLPPNPAELLHSPQMGRVLTELRTGGARLVLDAPPLLPIADAQGLLDQPQIDGVIIVARLRQTTREEVRRTRAVLEQHRLQPLGLVVTGVKGARSYGGYGTEGKAPPASQPAASVPSLPPTAVG